MYYHCICPSALSFDLVAECLVNVLRQCEDSLLVQASSKQLNCNRSTIICTCVVYSGLENGL